ncbi:DUF4476 domain-containing protein [Fulvivirgaceae bacterium BMA10]|uniref:DUF4476 domain-containing protein n=1 Tax=Splendidivirga corallicola TaxID=3051826 RepID=A0ABT8KUZ4_9BACT|nr:DUF4476 domain-containing protein [Fulvivirgaceae bacterium BMA10]
MKKLILIFASMLFLSFQVTARHASVIFRAEHGEPIIVILDGNKMNARPTDVVKLRNVHAGRHDLRIKVFKNGVTRELRKPIFLKRDYKTKFVLFSKGRRGPIYLNKVKVEPLYKRHNGSYHGGYHSNDYNGYCNDPYHSHNNGRYYNHYNDYDRRGYANTNHSCSYAEHLNIDKLVHSIRRKHYDDQRLIVAKSAIRKKGIFAEDIKRIMKQFSFESSRVEFAAYAYHKTCDKDNFYVVYDALYFDSSIRKLERQIHDW